MKNKILALGKKYLKEAEYDLDKLIMLVYSKLGSSISVRLIRSILTPLIETANFDEVTMKRCERIIHTIYEGLKDALIKKYGPMKSADGVLYNDEKGFACGYTHRGSQVFKIGDKLFDPSWKGDYTDDELEKVKFVDRGSKTIKNIEDARQAAINFADYIS